jgi:hypothetical protein
METPLRKRTKERMNEGKEMRRGGEGRGEGDRNEETIFSNLMGTYGL